MKEEDNMKKTGIMTDSHSGILNEEAERLGIKVLPMPFYIGEKVYREGVDLSRDEFYDMLRKGVDVSTSQPSPVEVLDMWKEMLKEYEEIVYIPLSSALSGSCMAAQAMANEDAFAGKVFVVDNGRVATPMHRSVLDAVEMAEKGYSAAEIKKILEETREKMTIYIGLSTLEYLKKGGRVSSMTALAADVLNIKPVMHFSTGTLDTYQKCRGMKKSRKVMIDAMKHELETNFREEYAAGKVYLMAASSSTDEATEEWVNQIKESFEFLRSEGYLYVDKTELVYRLVTKGKPYFLSRPRRFGKSLLLSTLEAYFKGKKELFEGLAIEKLEQNWFEYPVLHLSLNAEKYDSKERLERMLELQLESWEEMYGVDKGTMTYSGRFITIIRRAYEQTGRRVVVLVDEYDKPMLQTFDKPDLQEDFRKTLTAFYTVLKDADPYLQFVFITGVTKFAQMGIFSTLNQLNDISFDLEYNTI